MGSEAQGNTEDRCRMFELLHARDGNTVNPMSLASDRAVWMHGFTGRRTSFHWSAYVEMQAGLTVLDVSTGMDCGLHD